MFEESDAFQAPIGFIATAPALRRALLRSEEVRRGVEGLRTGEVSEDVIRHFTQQLLRDLKPGEQFPHDLTVSALAVALEGYPTGFADEFLLDLARLQSAEMAMSIRVARECLKNRPAVQKAPTGAAATVRGEAAGTGTEHPEVHTK